MNCVYNLKTWDDMKVALKEVCKDPFTGPWMDTAMEITNEVGSKFFDQLDYKYAVVENIMYNDDNPFRIDIINKSAFENKFKLNIGYDCTDIQKYKRNKKLKEILE